MSGRLAISYLLIFLTYSCLNAQVSTGFNEKIVDAILFEDPDKVGLPENEIERNLILSITSRNSSPEESAEKLIAAKGAILVGKRINYYPTLDLVEGYFYMFEDIAKAAESGGADAVSAINTVVGMGINIQSRKPKLYTTYGGLSGPAIKPIAIANVHKIHKVVSLPIIGIGGIANFIDVFGEAQEGE